MRWAGYVARMGEGRNAFKNLAGIPTRRRSLGRPRRRWEDNIRKNFKEIGINTRNCVDSAQYRDYQGALVNAAFYLWVPYASSGPKPAMLTSLGISLKISKLFHSGCMLCQSCSSRFNN